MQSADQLKKEHNAAEAKAKLEVLNKIRDHVREIDLNGDNTVSMEELETCLGGNDGSLLLLLLDGEDLHLPRGFSPEELLCMLDQSGDGTLEIDEFVGSFYRLIDSGPFQQVCLLQAGINSIKRLVRSTNASTLKLIEDSN